MSEINSLNNSENDESKEFKYFKIDNSHKSIDNSAMDEKSFISFQIFEHDDQPKKQDELNGQKINEQIYNKNIKKNCDLKIEIQPNDENTGFTSSKTKFDYNKKLEKLKMKIKKYEQNKNKNNNNNKNKIINNNNNIIINNEKTKNNKNNKNNKKSKNNIKNEKLENKKMDNSKNKNNEKIEYNKHNENNNIENNKIENNNIENNENNENNGIYKTIEYKIQEIKENKILGRKTKNSDKEGRHNKFSDDNLVRKVKCTLLDIITIFINSLLKEIDKNKTDNSKKRELLKMNQGQIVSSKADYNKEFLKKPLKDILSDKISTKYTKYDPLHNKNIIDSLLNDENEELRLLFYNIFNMTFLDCLEHFRGSKYNCLLEGLQKLDDICEKFKEPEYIKAFKHYVTDFENIIEKKKVRNRISWKKQKKKDDK